MQIIKAVEKDLNEILTLCRDCTRNMAVNLIDQWDSVYPNKEIFLEDIKNGSLYLALFDNSEEIAACIAFNEHQDPEYKKIKWTYTSPKVTIVHRLMVHPKHEGKGIAQDLVRYVEKLAQRDQYGAVRLDVFVKNLRAVNFYKKLGYRFAGKVTFRKGEFFCCEKPMSGN
ncbi:GNAT family N-acetyltransferase [Desulfosporosinus sp. PR]|uniref:GNAT family N-acetyltransferase n=1 Tax=Candidatus Desulfosporosinus nitrosoreducens TaxID=3401928 RepID=UPI0027EC81D2|nr:GNAT family N-acetyltransferase [Desulfosporosinus sp. PR]MDQ7092320.1 GNAT family N-acetyltransferase [Desulfosporosinus sp. PR]